MRVPKLFYMAGPTDYVVKFVGGKRSSEGKGRIFFVGPRTVLVRVSTTDRPVPFSFTELTSDNQEAVVSGEVQLRLLVDRLIDRRDFSIDPVTGMYLTEDMEALEEEVRYTLQRFIRRAVKGRDLKDVLSSATELETAVLEAIRAEESNPFDVLGVQVVSLFVTAITPANPDLRRALEAEARERMLAAADKAVAERRKDAATNDRDLKAYEADTAELLEARRAKLVETRNKNILAEATADAEAVAKRLAPYSNVDAMTILALGIREIATSGRVGTFTLTPDILTAIGAATSSKESGRKG